MNRDPLKHRRWTLVAALFALAAVSFGPSAKEQAVAATRHVQVYPKYFVAGGKRFADLDRLEDWVKATGTRSLELRSCMWTATEQLAAAIERFSHVYLDVRWIEPGKAGCPVVKPDSAASAS